MTLREKVLCLVSNDALKKADAIVVLEGDGLVRVQEGARLFREGWAPVVVLSGGVQRPPVSIPAADMRPHLREAGVPEGCIILEEHSQHTRDQAVEVTKLVRSCGWSRIILIASPYHQYRAYLTFLKAMQEAGAPFCIINAPARQIPWFASDDQGRRIDLLDGEMERVDLYRASGHVATDVEALAYQEWKESM